MSMAPSPSSVWLPDRQYRWLSILLVVTSMIMLQLPDGFTWQYVGTTNFSGDSRTTVVSQLQWFPLFGLATWVLVVRFRLTMAMLRHLNPFLMLLLLWIMLSTLWSYDPSLTLRRGIKVVGTVVIAWGVVMVSWDYGRYERGIRISLLIYLVGSLVFIALIPRLGIHHAYESEPLLAGSWRGLATHKNGFGAMASMSLVFWVHALMTSRRKGMPAFALLISLVCLVGARSSTSLICGVVTSVVMLACLKTEIARRPGALFLLAGALFLVPFLWFVIVCGFPSLEQALGPFTSFVGRDLTFTGRVPLWNALLEEIPQRPILGAGYQAFWGGPGTLSDAARIRAGWQSVNGHNGYLDTTNEIGVIGLVLLLASIAFDVRRSWRFSALSASVFAIHFSVQFYQMVLNLSETMFLRTISLTYMLTALSSFHLARISLDLDLRRRSGEPLPLNPTVSAPSPTGFLHAHP